MLSALYTIVLLFFIFIFIIHYQNRNLDDKYFKAADTIKKLGLTDCIVRSTIWVPVNYYTGNVYYLYDLNYTLSSKSYALVFPCCATIDDPYSMDEIFSYNPLLKTEDFIIISDPATTNETCSKRSGWDEPMVDDKCNFIKGQFGNFAEKVCNIIDT